MTISIEQGPFDRPDIVAQESHMPPETAVDYAAALMRRGANVGGVAFIGYTDQIGVKEANAACVVPLEPERSGNGPLLDGHSPYEIIEP